jgi:hypothetical protein
MEKFPEAHPPRRPPWLVALGILALTILGASLVWAVAMGLTNLGRIGV